MRVYVCVGWCRGVLCFAALGPWPPLCVKVPGFCLSFFFCGSIEAIAAHRLLGGPCPRVGALKLPVRIAL